jgi:putative transposase
MLIVPIGKVCLQEADSGHNQEFMPSFVEQIQRAILGVIQRCIEEELEAETTGYLYRRPYRRCKKVHPEGGRGAYCQRCGSRDVRRFQRNGHYRRGLDTHWGHLCLEMPQVRCECGGSVRLPYQVLRPRQRLWDDLEWEIRAEYGWGLSLRWIKAKQDAVLQGSLGLRTLNQCIHRMAAGLPVWKQRQCLGFPPVVRLDGIWVTVMKRTASTKKDSSGRLRWVKQGLRKVILVAQGVWPGQHKQEVLAWQIADSESEQAWKNLLYEVHQAELHVNGQIDLLIGDGSTGLEAAQEAFYPQVPLQRCIFHKLRNLACDLRFPEDLPRPKIREQRRAVLQEAATIWQAPHESGAWQRYSAFCQKWAPDQPQAVATLQRDFEHTLSFYQVQAQAKAHGEHWPATFLRTTSQLERENRNLRRRIRQAVLFHSDIGLVATIYQNIVLRQALNDPACAGKWMRLIEEQIGIGEKFMC